MFILSVGFLFLISSISCTVLRTSSARLLNASRIFAEMSLFLSVDQELASPGFFLLF
jgi:hypothetical protein